MPIEPPLNHHLNRIYRQITYAYNICRTLQSRLQRELESPNFLSANAEELTLVLSELTNVLIRQLQDDFTTNLSELWALRSKHSEQEKNLSKKIDKLEKDLYHVTEIASNLVPVIKYALGAKAEANPWSVVSLLDQTCRKLYSNSRIIIRPKWEHNYSYINITAELMDWAQYARRNELDKIYLAFDHFLLSNKLNKKNIYASLAYPPFAGKNLLHLANWGHELGHFIDNMEGVFQKKALYDGQDLDTNAMISEIIASEVTIGVRNEVVRDAFENFDNDQATNFILGLRNIWATELFADLFSVRMFGPAAILSTLEVLRPIHERYSDASQNRPRWNGYPPFRYRLQKMMYCYKEWFSSDFSLAFDDGEYSSSLISELNNLERFVAPKIGLKDFQASPKYERLVDELLRSFVPIFDELTERRFENRIMEIYSRAPQCFLIRDDFSMFNVAANDIENSLPPDFNLSHAVDKNKWLNAAEFKILPLSVNAGWTYWLAKRRFDLDGHPYIEGDSDINLSVDHDNISDSFADTNFLLLKTIQNVEATRWFVDRKGLGRDIESTPSKLMESEEISNSVDDEFKDIRRFSHLSHDPIVQRVNNDLVIRPLLDKSVQIGTSSVDLRLGNTFVINKQLMISKLDPIEPHFLTASENLQEEIYLPFGEKFVLHPGQFALGATLEYISMPLDLLGMLVDRSSWTRIGVSLGAMQKVIPGFQGCLTLPLKNIGVVPVVLYPGVRIAQLLLLRIG